MNWCRIRTLYREKEDFNNEDDRGYLHSADYEEGFLVRDPVQSSKNLQGLGRNC